MNLKYKIWDLFDNLFPGFHSKEPKEPMFEHKEQVWTPGKKAPSRWSKGVLACVTLQNKMNKNIFAFFQKKNDNLLSLHTWLAFPPPQFERMECMLNVKSPYGAHIERMGWYSQHSQHSPQIAIHSLLGPHTDQIIISRWWWRE